MYVVVVQGINGCCGVSSIATSLTWSLSIHGAKCICLNASNYDYQSTTDLLIGLTEKNSLESGWSDLTEKELNQDNISLIKWGNNCFYLPYGKKLQENYPVNEYAKRIIEKLSSNNKFDYLIIDAGTCNSVQAKSFSKLSNINLTIITADSNTLIRLNDYTPAENEYILINKFMMKSSVMNDIEMQLRKSRLASCLLNYVVQYDECMVHSFMQMMPVTRFMPIASSAKTIEKLMIDISLICRLTKDTANDTHEKKLNKEESDE